MHVKLDVVNEKFTSLLDSKLQLLYGKKVLHLLLFFSFPCETYIAHFMMLQRNSLRVHKSLRAFNDPLTEEMSC